VRRRRSTRQKKRATTIELPSGGGRRDWKRGTTGKTKVNFPGPPTKGRSTLRTWQNETERSRWGARVAQGGTKKGNQGRTGRAEKISRLRKKKTQQRGMRKGEREKRSSPIKREGGV